MPTTTPEPPRKSILVLSTHITQKAIITNAVGQVEHPLSDFMFLYGPGTEIDMSCSLTWRGEFYVFGGNAEPTQVSKLGCPRFQT